MKKLIAMLLALVMVMAMVACGAKDVEAPATEPATEAPTEAATEAPTEEVTEAPVEEEVEAPAELTVMTHDDYVAAELDAEVLIETYVQAHQSWWEDKITVYCQSPDGAYFLYELACDQDAAANLVPGTKIRVNGFKGEWAGEVEVMDGTFEFVEDGDTFIAEALDVTDLLGTDEMIAHQNEFVSFKGMTVKAVEFKNGEPGDDIYITLTKDDADYNFCVEYYLTGADTVVYTTACELAEGDVVDVEGFLYWYEGMNPHITSIVPAA